MKKSSEKQVLIGPRGEAARQQLIRREMRFVLQQDVRRFSGQLQARLLDEGCNLHPVLARAMFYVCFERRIAADLPATLRSRLNENHPETQSDLNHPLFHRAVKYCRRHLPDAETEITAAVLDTIEALKLEWRCTANDCTIGSLPENDNLKHLIMKISRLNPEGYLARHGYDTIIRRLRIAIVTSLLRHVRQPDLLREKFGNVPQMIAGMRHEPALFENMIEVIRKQIPYVQLLIAQTFWRTLNNLDTELIR